MIFVEPGEFFPAWDISIKVPMIVKNLLPIELLVMSFRIDSYNQVSGSTRKEIRYQQ